MSEILISTSFVEDNSATSLYDFFDKFGYEYFSFENGQLNKLDSARDYFKWKTSQDIGVQAGPGIILESLYVNKTISFLLFCGLKNMKTSKMNIFYVQSVGGRFDGLTKFYETYEEAIKDFNEIRDYNA